MSTFKRPPSSEDAEEQGLYANPPGVHTFSNGSEWDSWASNNCHACRFYDPNVMGKHCAFEAAAFIHMVSPKLATLFGWTQTTTEYGPLSGWEPPEACPFKRDAGDEDEDREPPPFVDPTQLVLGGIDPLFPITEPAPRRPARQSHVAVHPERK